MVLNCFEFLSFGVGELNSLPLSFLVFNFNYTGLESWVLRIGEILSQSHLEISFCFFYCTIGELRSTFKLSSVLIFNFLQLNSTFGSRKALRSRLGYLVSWVLRSGVCILNSLFKAFQVHLHFRFRSGSIQVTFYLSD